MHLDELLSSIRGFIVPTVRVGGNLRGSDRYPVNEPRLSKVKGGTSIFRVITQVNTSRKTKQGTRRFKRVGIHSMPISMDEKGVPRTSGISTESGTEVNTTR